jgi:prevent-host-death family protein
MESAVYPNLNAAHADWPLQDAKARFSELVRRALSEGPQHVSVRGQPSVVVLSESEYTRLTAAKPSLVDLLLADPPWPNDVVDTINSRSQDQGRDVSF